MTVTVVGMGPGAAEYTTPLASQAVARADIVIAADKWLDSVDAAGAIKMSFQPLERMIETLKAKGGSENIAVLVSGDPSISSLLGVIRRALPELEVGVIPGVSSAQVALARLGLEWKDVAFVSLHGHPIELIDGHLTPGARLLLLTDAKHSPKQLGRYLVDRRWSGRAVVAERLTEADEKITKMPLADLADFQATQPNIVILELRGN